jgi:hypothetical protein
VDHPQVSVIFQTSLSFGQLADVKLAENSIKIILFASSEKVMLSLVKIENQKDQ